MWRVTLRKTQVSIHDDVRLVRTLRRPSDKRAALVTLATLISARAFVRAQRSRRQSPNWRRHPCRSGLTRCYCGCGSDRRLLSSCMSTATLASALACSRPWCAQKSSSPELASSTRTYAWAPQRSQTSSAVSGLVGAIAPVNVAFLRVVPPACQPSGFGFLPLQLSTTHTPASAFPTPGGVRHKRKPSAGQAQRNCRHQSTRCLRPTGTRGQYR